MDGEHIVAALYHESLRKKKDHETLRWLSDRQGGGEWQVYTPGTPCSECETPIDTSGACDPECDYAAD